MTAAAAARTDLTPYREADVRAHAFTDAVATWREVRAAVRAGAYADQADAMAELRSARLVARLAALQWLRASTEVDTAIVAEAFGDG